MKNFVVKDLSDPRWIMLKGALFLLLGVCSALLVILEHPTLRVALLFTLAAWCFCRFYYFAFYVIEKYVDPDYRFSGLGSFFVYLIRQRRSPLNPASGSGLSQPRARQK